MELIKRFPAYQQGRKWLASNARSLADPKDEERADQLESQVLLVSGIACLFFQRRRWKLSFFLVGGQHLPNVDGAQRGVERDREGDPSPDHFAVGVDGPTYEHVEPAGAERGGGLRDLREHRDGSHGRFNGRHCYFAAIFGFRK